jgi:hypothetical protein
MNQDCDHQARKSGPKLLYSVDEPPGVNKVAKHVSLKSSNQGCSHLLHGKGQGILTLGSDWTVPSLRLFGFCSKTSTSYAPVTHTYNLSLLRRQRSGVWFKVILGK